MRFAQVFLICIILIKKLSGETITTNSSSLADQKQKLLIDGSIDLSVNPCEDFYQYACGKWENFHKEAGTKYQEIISLLDYNVNKEMARVMSEINLQNQPSFVKKAYQYFKSCDDLKAYDTVHYLNWMTEHEKIKFPSLVEPEKSVPEECDWVRTLALMRMYGMNNIFLLEYVEKRRDDPSKYIIYLEQPDMEYDDTAITREYLEQILLYLSEFIDEINVSKLWHEIQAFELELKNLDNFKVIEIDWPVRKLEELPLPWLKDYIKILLNQTELSPNMEIYLQNIPYFMALDDLIKRYSQSFLCKYLEIRFLVHLEYQGPLNLTAEDCLFNVRSILSISMNWLYENRHPDLQLEFPKINELYEDIKNNIKKNIQQNKYGFNKTVIDYLLAKINNMQLKLNNIPRLDTVKTIESFYDDLDLNADDFYANHLKIMNFNFMATHNLLSNNTTKEMDFFVNDVSDSAYSSTSYFLDRSNVVVVPLTLLQYPVYQPDYADVYKYSSLGFILAQTMFFGFGNAGLEFDYKGGVVSQVYKEIFENSLFVVSFNCPLEIDTSELPLKIADISGLDYAYKMFNESKSDDKDVSLSKLFFLNFAQYFCGSSNSTEFVSSTSRASDRSRIMDTLTHFQEFTKVFQCNSTNRMYSNEPCNIWR